MNWGLSIFVIGVNWLICLGIWLSGRKIIIGHVEYYATKSGCVFIFIFDNDFDFTLFLSVRYK